MSKLKGAWQGRNSTGSRRSELTDSSPQLAERWKMMPTEWLTVATMLWWTLQEPVALWLLIDGDWLKWESVTLSFSLNMEIAIEGKGRDKNFNSWDPIYLHARALLNSYEVL